MKTILLCGMLVLFGWIAAVNANGQATARPTPAKSPADHKTTAAYAEIALKKAELESELESLLVEYTEEFPRVKEARANLSFLKKAEDRLASAAPEPYQRFTAALGKLLVRKSELEADLARLLESLQPSHPEVRRARRKAEVFETAIKEILG